MIELLFRLGFALLCGIAVVASVFWAIVAAAVAFWALVIQPNWLGKRGTAVRDLFMRHASPKRRQAEVEAET